MPNSPVVITVDELRTIVSYDPHSGKLFWKIRSGIREPGDEVNSLDRNGYNRLRYKKVTYLVHRIAWALHTGAWPEEMIDHINRDPSDNRIANLREATRLQNYANQSVPRHNTSGFRGVSQHRNGRDWVARIMVEKRRKYLGTYGDPVAAAKAYDAATLARFGEFAGLNFPTAQEGK